MESRGIVTKNCVGLMIFGCCTEGDDVQMSSLAWSLLVTENQRAGDTSDTDCSTRSGETQAQASSETGDCNAGPGRCERCERVLRTRAGRVTHMRLEERGQLSAFWEQSWIQGKENVVF